MAHPSTGTASPSTADSWVVKATLLLASTLTVMSGATIAPSLPAMQIYFGETTNVDFWVRLVLTMPALFIVMGSPIAGQLVDQVGRKPLLIGAAALYGFAGGSGLVLNSLPTILMGRALLGLAVAGVMVSATTLIADYYQGDARASFMGLQAAFMGLGGVLFLTVGGFVSDINWRLPFAIYLLAWLLLPTMISALPEPQRQNSVNDSSPNAAPIEHLPLKLMAFICASALLTQMIFYLIPVQLPFYLKQLSNASATQSGLAIALSTLLSAVASMNYGKLKQRLSFIKILAIALVLMGLGYGGIGLAQTYGLLLVAMIPTGLGLGLLMPNLNVWTATETPDSLRGRALGGLTTFFFLGQFLSPIASQPISAAVGLTATYGLAGVLLLVVGALIWQFKSAICRGIASQAGRT